MNTNSLVAQIIVDILTQEMGLPAGAVWLRDQNRLIPNDNGLYISVGMVRSEIMANKNSIGDVTVGNVTTTNEYYEVQARETIQIDLLSRSNDALTRTWEIAASLQSIYAQQQQELNNCKIFKNPVGFINTSAAEVGSQLNRYTLTFQSFVWYRKTKALSSTNGDYYDDFHQRVDDEVSIGTDKPIIAFEINQQGIVP